MAVLLIVAMSILSLLGQSDCKIRGMPLVAVVLQPASPSTANILPLGPDSHTYVPTSYVQQIESAGGIPILVPFDLNIDMLDRLLESTQMLFIPGGPAELVDANGEVTKYQERIHYMIQHAMKRNDAGDYYPVLATCLGFENMVISFANQNISILQSGYAIYYRQVQRSVL